MKKTNETGKSPGLVLGFMAMAMAVLFLGSAVFADTPVITPTGVSISTDTQVVAGVRAREAAIDRVDVVNARIGATRMKEIRLDSLNDARYNKEAMKARVFALRNETKEVISDWRESAADLRVNIARARNTPVDVSREFSGWNVGRIVNASELRGEQKEMLLKEYREAKGNMTERSHFLIFADTGRFIVAGNLKSDSEAGMAYGFSNIDPQPIVFVFSNGVVAGVHNGAVFSGTYADGSITLQFPTGTVQAKYFVY